MSNYTPKYADEDIAKMGNTPNISGLSPQANVTIEEREQAKIANNPTWYIARKMNHDGINYSRGDSRSKLEELGFTDIEHGDDLFYSVKAPSGWTKETEGYWTTVKDEMGQKRMSQFYKGAWYDRDAHVNITVPKSE